MTFLNPYVLFGLLAASIPIILHLLNLRKVKTIEFSTLTFLKELQHSKMRRIKIRQIILLILRILLVIFIVLAFARPAFRGYLGSLGSHAKTTVVIILDDSFSMDVSDEHGQLFKQAKEIALQLTTFLKEGDDVALIKLSELPTPAVERATSNFYAVRTAIQEAPLAFKHARIEDALTFAGKLLTESLNFNKEVYLITDMQKSQFASELKADSKLKVFDERTKFFVLPLGRKKVDNLSIESVEVKSRIFEKEKPVTIDVTVKNYGDTPVRNYLTSIYLEGNRLMQKGVDVDPGISKTVQFNIAPKKTGFARGFIEIEDDLISEDNKRFFSFYVPEKLNVLLISATPKDAMFLNAALMATTSEHGSETQAPADFTVTELRPDRLSSLNLTKFNLLLLSNVRSFSASDANRLKDYVASGGGMMIFPGNDMDITNYNSTLLRVMQIPAIQGTNGSLKDKTAYLSFGTIDFDHPIFNGMFESTPTQRDKTQRQIDSPNIFFSLLLQASATGQSVINTSSSAPFLFDYNVGNGRVLFCAVAPNMEWSDFPLKGIFVPLMHRSVYYLSSTSDIGEQHLVGEKFDVSATTTTASDKFIIKNPNGDEEFLKPRPIRNGVLLSVEQTAMPGTYEITKNGQTLKKLSVNLDPLESDLTRIETADIEQFFKRLGVDARNITFLNRDANFEEAVLQSRYGMELWKYCLLFALLLAVIEMLVAREGKQEAVVSRAIA
jgi:hypothetical protein